MGLFWFISGLLLVVAGVVTVVAGVVVGTSPQPARFEEVDYGYGAKRKAKVADAVPGTKLPAILCGLFLVLPGVLTVFTDSYHTVAARGVAVQTAFGRVRGHVLGPGWHWVHPWYSIEEFDASVQTLKFYKDEKNDDGTCITVRLGNNTTACADVTAQWQINRRGDVKDLYLQYRSFDNIHNNLVIRQLGSALNEVFGTYDPLAAVGTPGVGTQGDTPTVNTKDLQQQVKGDLQRDLGSSILINSVTIPLVHFDGDTENRLRALQQAKANTRIAEQNEQTAQAQARANADLANQSAISNPGVEYQNCLNVTSQLADKDQLKNLPTTWNCNQTSGNGLIINGR